MRWTGSCRTRRSIRRSFSSWRRCRTKCCWWPHTASRARRSWILRSVASTRAHPLVAALGSREPVFVQDMSAAVPRTDRRADVLRDPASCRHERRLSGPAGDQRERAAHRSGRHSGWCARWGSRCRASSAASCSRKRDSARSGSLLYSIINAVTDPILLTDTEGRLLIANARAETLFTAPRGGERGAARAPSR